MSLLFMVIFSTRHFLADTFWNEKLLLLLGGELLAERCRRQYSNALLGVRHQEEEEVFQRQRTGMFDAKHPCPLPSTKPCGPQSSGAERLRLSLSARWILIDQEVCANQVVVAARRRWHGVGPPLELIEPGARKTSTRTTWPFQRLAGSPWCS